jgi:hypothetical protein
MNDSSCARQRASSSTFVVCESLFPIRSHGEYYLKVPLRVLVESSAPNTTPGDHPCKSQPAKSKSQPVNTKVSRQLAGPKGYVQIPTAIAHQTFENFVETTGGKSFPRPTLASWKNPVSGKEDKYFLELSGYSE